MVTKLQRSIERLSKLAGNEKIDSFGEIPLALADLRSLAADLATDESAEAFETRCRDYAVLALLANRHAPLVSAFYDGALWARDDTRIATRGVGSDFEKRVRGAVEILSIEDCSIPRDDFERGQRAGFAQCLVAIRDAMKSPVPPPPSKGDSDGE